MRPQSWGVRQLTLCSLVSGIEPHGNTVLKPACFTVETVEAGLGEVLVYIEDPEGHTEEAKVVANNDKNRTYSVSYMPKVAGLHKVTVLFAGQNIDKSPFAVNVGMALGDANKVTARGPGLEPVGNVANKPTYFDIYTAGAGTGDVGVVIVDPQGRRDTVEVALEDKGDNIFRCTYRPVLEGPHAVHVTFAGAQIPKSPFTVNVAEACSPNACRATGRGLQPKGVRVKELADFKVFTKGAGTGELKVVVKGPKGTEEPVKVRDVGDGVYECEYYPVVPGNPFEVQVGPEAGVQKVRAWGPGLETGMVGKSADFVVEAIGTEVGTLGFSIEGPSQAKIECDDKGDGSCDVRYWPTEPGDYAVHVAVGEGSHPSKVKVYGPGVEKTGLKANEPTYFTVDCSEAGQGDVSIGIKCAPGVVGPVEADIDFDIIKNDNDTFTVKYTPPGPGRHTIMVLFANQGAGKAKPEVHFAGAMKGEVVRDFEIIDNHDYSYTVKYTAVQQGNMVVTVTYGGDPIPKSPFPVHVAPPLDLSKVKVQGLSNKVDVGRDQEFAVLTKGAGGQGNVDVKISSPSRRPIPCKVETGTTRDSHSVKYMPPEEGPYKVCAYGPGLKGGFVGKLAPFTIDTKGAGTGGLGLTVEGPCEAKIECQDNGDGSCSVSYLPTEPGEYAINILFAEAHIPGSPFKADIKPVFDPSKVTASGPGLERGKVGEVATFMVDCSKAGDAELTIEIISDSGVKAEVVIQNNSDGTYSITYIPSFPGTYTITIKYGGYPVPKFPARVNVDPAVDTSNVKVFGPGVEPRGVLREVTTEFTVDARSLTKTGGSHVKVRVINPSGAKTDTYITDNGDGTYRVQYTPYEDGVHLVEVTYDDVPVPKSPFRVGVTEGCDPSRVRAYGPGLEGGLVNKSNRFTVETRGAGTGGLGLAIEGPSEAKMSCQDNKDGSCSVEYIPFTPGDYDVNITFGGRPIPGSPFRVPVKDVVDPSKVKCSGPGLGAGVRARVPQTFTVDCSKAGVAPLDVKVLGPTGVAEPVEVRDNGDGTHKVNYTPATDGPYTALVNPFKVRVLPAHDASKVRASGPGLSAAGIPASLPVEFTIDARDAGEGLLTVQILDPEGKPKKANIRDNGDGTYTVSYVPDMTGRYTITIKYGGDEIPYSPFRIHALPAGDASKCLVTGACLGPTIQIGEETVITVDAKAAGKGKVTCKVSTPDGAELDVDVVENHDGTFDIYYTAPEPGKYVITIRFGGELIPKSPFHATEEPVAPPESVDAMLRPFNLVIPFTVQKGDITGEVRMPSGKTARPHITDNKDGTVTVKYAPVEKGLHEMDIKYDGNHIPGSPLQFYVDAINARHVSAYGPGLSHGMVNKPATFTIVTKDAGEGISFTPKEVGEHVVSVRKSGKHVTNSPFKIMVGQSEIGDASKVKVSGKGLVEGRTFEVSEFIVDTRTAGYGGLGLSIEGPSKVDINCEDMEDGTCKVTYCPTEPGNYIINIKFADKHVPGSPFTVKARPACRP
ncbi:Filamin-C [Varanus komodoensis]|nr:Filamin-C [Varanus komodoensis]